VGDARGPYSSRLATGGTRTVVLTALIVTCIHVLVPIEMIAFGVGFDQPATSVIAGVNSTCNQQ
jgi:hypothetical protein